MRRAETNPRPGMPFREIGDIRAAPVPSFLPVVPGTRANHRTKGRKVGARYAPGPASGLRLEGRWRARL